LIKVLGRGVRFAPILVAVVLTVLSLVLLKATADVFLLLFIGILISLYLGAVAEWVERRAHVPPRAAFITAILVSLGGLTLLFWILIPPVVAQTEALVKALPGFITTWEKGLDDFIGRFPALRPVWPTGEHKVLLALYDQLRGTFSNVLPRVLGIVHGAINVFAVAVMGLYLSVQPALYREWVIALFPPLHRDLVRDVLTDLGTSLRAWIVGQLFAMAMLAALTALGLRLLNVPFWGTFGIFTGLVAIVPFFGTLVSTALPALFVLNGPGFYGLGSFTHALLVVALGVVVHIFEGNVVAPLVMAKKVDLPPVLTIMSVLVMGKLLGPLGLVVAVPTLAAVMVIVRRILITRIYEGQGFRRTTRERPLVLRVPVQTGGVLLAPGSGFDVVTAAERAGRRASA
jgi:predicted PurR-regulated permease PerM